MCVCVLVLYIYIYIYIYICVCVCVCVWNKHVALGHIAGKNNKRGVSNYSNISYLPLDLMVSTCPALLTKNMFLHYR